MIFERGVRAIRLFHLSMIPERHGVTELRETWEKES